MAFYSLQHIPRPQLVSVLGEIQRVLAPQGAFALATHLGEGEVFATELLGHHFSAVGGTLFSQDEIECALEVADFTVEEVQRRAPRPHEHQSQRLYVIARAPR